MQELAGTNAVASYDSRTGLPDKTRILRHLSTDMGSVAMVRFFAKLRRDGDCLIWTAGTGAGGYGSFKLARGVTVTTHRLALVAATGRDPDGLEAAHSCGNVLCCNPAHLRWATRQSNEDDKRQAGEALNAARSI